MTDEGFVWLDAPAPRTRALVVPLEPASAHQVEPALEPTVEPAPRANLTRWQTPPRRGLASRLATAAFTALRGRRAMLGVCLELTDALALELRRVLSVP